MKKRNLIIPAFAVAVSFSLASQASADDYTFLPQEYGAYSQWQEGWQSTEVAYTTYSGVDYATSFTETSSDTTNTYPVGQCTWGVKELASWVGNYWGNAADWDDTALSLGYHVGTTPKVGAVIVWDDGAYGHVAYVTDVDENGNIQVLEANYGGSAEAASSNGIGNYRGWFNPTETSNGASISYIYPPDSN